MATDDREAVVVRADELRKSLRPNKLRKSLRFKWCNACNGKGCERCNGRGSVERTEAEKLAAKREHIAAVKREAYELLQLCHVPHPLCALIADLWGGYPAFWKTSNPAFVVAARIDGQYPDGELGRNELARLVRDELQAMKAANRLDPDFKIASSFTKQITSWRRHPEYDRIVRVMRGE